MKKSRREAAPPAQYRLFSFDSVELLCFAQSPGTAQIINAKQQTERPDQKDYPSAKGKSGQTQKNKKHGQDKKNNAVDFGRPPGRTRNGNRRRWSRAWPPATSAGGYIRNTSTWYADRGRPAPCRADSVPTTAAAKGDADAFLPNACTDTRSNLYTLSESYAHFFYSSPPRIAASTASMMNRCNETPRASAAAFHRSFVPASARILNSSNPDIYFFVALFCASLAAIYTPPLCALLHVKCATLQLRQLYTILLYGYIYKITKISESFLSTMSIEIYGGI